MIKLKQKIVVLMMCFVIIIALICSSYAWFSAKRNIQTVAQIATPIQLYLSGGHKEDVEYINLGGVDTTKANGKTAFVFSVHGTDIQKYDLQLAHTTNIPFTYKIFNATELEDGVEGDVLYVSPENNKKYYYNYNSGEQIGKYINQDETSKIANDSMKDKGYNKYNYVQKNAYPLFYLQENIATNMDANLEFLQYYVLEISWTDAIPIDKETDMVYVMVGIA